MKRAIILTSLVLFAAACDSNYDPPKAYAMGAGYGTNGRAFGGQQSPTPFVYVDAGEDDSASRQKGDVVVAQDISNDFSSGVVSCITDDHGGDYAYGLYCKCLEDNAVAEDDQDCTCDFLVCIADPPDADKVATWLDICISLGKKGGDCTEAAQ